MPTLAYQVINQESAPVPIHLKHLKTLPGLKFGRLIENTPSPELKHLKALSGLNLS
jgi:hypothetical protein